MDNTKHKQQIHTTPKPPVTKPTKPAANTAASKHAKATLNNGDLPKQAPTNVNISQIRLNIKETPTARNEKRLHEKTPPSVEKPQLKKERITQKH